MTNKMSLEEFEKKDGGKAGRQCWVCSIPEREEIDQALHRNASSGLILRWLLNERGYSKSEATRNKVANHKEKGHHEHKAEETKAANSRAV